MFADAVLSVIKKEKTMKNKNINWKQLFEKAKSILLIILVTSGVAFYAGVQYQTSKTVEIDSKIKQAVSQLKK